MSELGEAEIKLTDVFMQNKKYFLLKPTNKCNLDCDYCYTKEGENPDGIDKEDFELFLDEASVFDEVKITWIGGEPLAKGIDFYKEVVDMEKNRDTEYINTIQTNGTLLDENWVDFLVGEKFGVGVSLDGPREIHNKHRTFCDDQGSFDNVMEGIELLREKNRNPGVISVVTKDHLNKEREIYDFFEESRLNVSFNILQTKDEDKRLSDGEYFDFHKKMYDLWIESDGEIEISPLNKIVESFVTGRNKSCEFSDCSQNFLCIDGDREVYPCAKFDGIDEFKLGKLGDDSFDDMFNRKKEMVSGNSERLYEEIEGSGCLFINYLQGNTYIEVYKEGREMIYNYIKDDLIERL